LDIIRCYEKARSCLSNLCSVVLFLFSDNSDIYYDRRLSNNHGLSFYGEHWDTAVPFGAGFIFCDYFLLRAANVLPKSKPPFKTISKLINILTVLLLFILLTPDTLNSFFDWSHIVDSSILFALNYHLPVG